MHLDRFCGLDGSIGSPPFSLNQVFPVRRSRTFECPTLRYKTRGLVPRRESRNGSKKETIDRSMAASPESPALVTSLACGPATEIFDVFETPDDASRLNATLLDIDYEALAFVANRRDALRLRRQIALEHANLLYLATRHQRLEAQPQDLIYSVGLIDYRGDAFAIKLLDWMNQKLRTGGPVLLGSFHSDNPCSAAQNYIYDWELIHRSEDDMHRLFELSLFGKSCSEILFEEEGITFTKDDYWQKANGLPRDKVIEAIMGELPPARKVELP